MGRVAIVVGHNEKLKGAYSTFLKIHEWDYYKEISEKIKELDKKNTIDVYFRNYKGSYSREMREVANQLNEKDYKLVIELHFNKVIDPKAHGAEVLLFHSSEIGIRESVRFLKKLKEAYNSKIRGLVPVTNESQRGGMGICNTRAPYILIEPFFSSNKEDSLKFKDRDKFAGFIYKFIMEVR